MFFFNIISSSFLTLGVRVLIILAIAIISHLLVLVVRKISQLLTRSTDKESSPKILTVTSLLTSILVFIIYFLAVGFILKELGISLTAYIASASVIGLAVGFGSQGLVQDMVTGFTLIVSNQIDVGDMVEINGQVGIITSIGMRFVMFENAFGAKVYIPNRNINVVINFPNKYISCQLDIHLVPDISNRQEIINKVNEMVAIFQLKYPKILMSDIVTTRSIKKRPSFEVLRLVFQIWPGRGSPIETSFKQELIYALKKIDPEFSDWMVSVNYELEKVSVKVDSN